MSGGSIIRRIVTLQDTNNTDYICVTNLLLPNKQKTQTYWQARAKTARKIEFFLL